MSKKRHVNQEAHYKDIINKQKRIIQDLKKKASRADKIEDRYTDLEEIEMWDRAASEDFLKNERQSANSCPDCDGELYIIDGEKIKVYICPDCKYRASKRA